MKNKGADLASRFFLLDQRECLFGRNQDINHLKKRINKRGLSVITGRPKMGKTWLVKAVADDLSTEQNCLIGYSISTRSETDLLSRALSALYTNWLNEASYKEQLRSLYERNKDKLVSKVGIFVAESLNQIIRNTTPIVGDIIEKGIQGLKKLNYDLNSDIYRQDPVTYEIVYDLVSILSDITKGRPILLILDAWEQGTAFNNDYGTIRNILSNLEKWPNNFHIFIVIRDDPNFSESLSLARDLCRSSYAADFYALSEMNIDDDCSEADKVFKYLLEHVPAAKLIKRTELFSLLKGNPAILEAWVGTKCSTVEELIKNANDANAYAYPEFDSIFPKLLSNQRALFDKVARLALVSEQISKREWDSIKKIVLDNSPESCLTDLESLGILVSESPPSFGHTSRYEAAGQWLITNKQAKPYVKELLKKFILKLTERVNYVDDNSVDVGRALISLIKPATELGLSPAALCVCVASATILGAPLDNKESALLQNESLNIAKESPPLRIYIASALAKATILSISDKNNVSTDNLFKKLDDIYELDRNDTKIKAILMGSYVTYFRSCIDSKNWIKSESILNKLRDFYLHDKNNDLTRDLFSRTLGAAMIGAHYTNDHEKENRILDEFRTIHLNHRDDDNVIKPFTLCHVIILHRALEQMNYAKAEGLFYEIADIYLENSNSEIIKQSFIRELMIMLSSTLIDQDSKKEALLDKLKELYFNRYGYNETAYDEFISVTFKDAHEAENLKKEDQILDNLRDKLNGNSEG